MNYNRLNTYINSVFVIIALVILIDFVIPGQIIEDKIIAIEKKRQQYYNAARNYHYSYKAITSKHRFGVSEKFAEMAKNNDQIKYSISLIFKEVNSYKLLKADDKYIYSLRIISGFIIPLIMMIGIGIKYKWRKDMSVLIFVLQTILIADFIFLLS